MFLIEPSDRQVETFFDVSCHAVTDIFSSTISHKPAGLGWLAINHSGKGRIPANTISQFSGVRPPDVMDCFHNEIKTLVPLRYKYLEGSFQSCNMYIGGTYCMKAYWDSLTKEQQGELAGKVGSTPGYLRLVFNGYKKASFVLAKKLEQCTSGAITKSDLRPDIYPKD